MLLENEMAKAYLIGRKTTLPNSHVYLAEPYLVFRTEEEAEAACDLVAGEDEKAPRGRALR